MLKFIESLTPSQWALIGVVLLAGGRALAKVLKWDKGVVFLDEFRAAIPMLDKYVKLASLSDVVEKSANLDKAANHLAINVPAVTGAEMKDVAVSLLKDKTASYGGITLSLNENGVSVDPTGLISNKAGKVGRWLKKVF